MRFFKASAVVLLTLFWVFATNHCALEEFIDLGFLSCSAQYEETHSDQHKGCEDDGDACASVENQLYKAEDAQVPVTAPAVLAAVFLRSIWAELSAPERSIQILPDTVPPELSCIWQFSYRTALPPRAPSLLS